MRLANADRDRTGDRVVVAVRLDLVSPAARVRFDVGVRVLVFASGRVVNVGLDVLATSTSNGDKIDHPAIGRGNR